MYHFMVLYMDRDHMIVSKASLFATLLALCIVVKRDTKKGFETI